MEIWKDVVGYEGFYSVSNQGRIKRNAKIGYRGNVLKERIMKSSIAYGYLHLTLSKHDVQMTFNIHKLVAIAFLNHKPCGHEIVINHKNFIRTDNRVENLELVTQRENSNKKHIKSSSEYVGVSWNKIKKMWSSYIYVKYTKMELGYFNNEYEAHLAYKKALSEINN